MAKTTLEVLLEKTDATSDDACWQWTGSKNPKGYGLISRPTGNGRYQTIRAHRAAFEIFTGRILSQGEVLHHLCGNKSCVNPNHLVVTDTKTHRVIHSVDRCPKGHLRSLDARGKRLCSSCKVEYDRRYREEHRDRIREYNRQYRQARRGSPG